MNSFISDTKNFFTRRLEYYKMLSNKSLLLHLLFVLLPCFFVMSVQAFSFGTALDVFTSFAFGLLLGILFLFVINCLSPSLLNENSFIQKVVAMLAPVGLLLAFTFSADKASEFFIIALVLYYLIFTATFVRPLQNLGRKVCVSVIMLSAFYMIAFAVFSGDFFTPDSYTYFDFSKTIFGNFGHTSTVRQYVVDTDMAITFPYLYPFLIAITNMFTRLEIYSGVLVNVILSCFICYLFYKISNKFFRNSYAAAIASLFLMTNSTYLDDLKAARTVPLALALVLLGIYFIMSLPKISVGKAFAAGLCGGAGLMTRFDAATISFAFLILIFVFSEKKTQIKASLFYLAGFGVFVLPWVIYSLVNFGTFWVSDTGMLGFLVTPMTTARYFSPGFEQQTFFNNSDAWFTQLFDLKLKYVWEYGFAAAADKIILVFLVLWFACIIVNYTRGKPIKLYFKSQSKLYLITAVFLIIYIIKFIFTCIAGFSYTFYHTETWVMLIFLLAQIGYSLAAFTKDTKRMQEAAKADNNQSGKGKSTAKNSLAVKDFYCINHRQASNLSTLNMATMVIAFLVICFTALGAKEGFEPNLMYSKIPANISRIETKLANETDPIVFYPDKYDSQPFAFGAYTGIKTYAPPETQDNDQNAIFNIMDNYIQPDYIVSITTIQNTEFYSRYGLEPVDLSANLYKVTSKLSYSAKKALFNSPNQYI